MNWIGRQIGRGKELAWKKADAALLEEARRHCPSGWEVLELRTEPGDEGRDVHLTARGHSKSDASAHSVEVTVRSLRIERIEGENALVWRSAIVVPTDSSAIETSAGRLVVDGLEIGRGHLVPERGIPDALRVAMGLVS